VCGAPVQSLDLEGIDVAKESIVQGTVVKDGAPVGGAYVRLLDSTGEFTAEVQTSATGAFRFFAAPGDWTLRTLTSGSTVDTAATAVQGEVVEVTVSV
jgi:DNA/RNA endonuclease YhcR with UshA esterase domain